MRLTLVISTLSSGGAERVMSIMANFWVRRDWPVTLLTFDDGSEKPFFNLDPQIIRIALNVMGLSGNAFQGVANK